MSEYKFIKQLTEEKKGATPAYVFDLDKMTEFAEKVKKCLDGKAELCYAMKANPFLIKQMLKVVSSLEVCSPGEFRICERAGIPMDRIVLSGVYKNPDDIAYMLDVYGDRGIYTVESMHHLTILNDYAKHRGIRLSVLIRVTSGNQFGVDEAEIRQIISERENYSGIEIEGLQFYSGTQKKNLSQMEEELRHLDWFIEELKEKNGFHVNTLEYGPGFFVPYFIKEKTEKIEDLLEEFKRILESLHFHGRIVLEMGRFLAASCGYYVTSIVDMKVNKEQSYAILDGGINHLNYYGQAMAMKQPYCCQLDARGNEKTTGEEELWNLCGALCTVSDVIVKRFPLHNPQIYDILVFERVGAYSVTEGIYLFLSRPLPKIYFWTQESGLSLVRDSIHTDLLNSENKGDQLWRN